METGTSEIATNCPVCDAEISAPAGVVVSEIVRCRECGSDLEVKNLTLLTLAEAPAEEEDWGE